MALELSKDHFGNPKIELDDHFSILLKKVAGSNPYDNAVRNVYSFQVQHLVPGSTSDHSFVCGDVSVPVDRKSDTPRENVLIKRTLEASGRAVLEMQSELDHVSNAIDAFRKTGSVDMKKLLDGEEVNLRDDLYLSGEDFILGDYYICVEDKSSCNPNVVHSYAGMKDDPLSKIQDAVSEKNLRLGTLYGNLLQHMGAMGIQAPQAGVQKFSGNPYTERLMKEMSKSGQDDVSDQREYQ